LLRLAALALLHDKRDARRYDGVMPRFVVLLHETPPGYPRPSHYDLMLEQGEVLWTWACDRLPIATGSGVFGGESPSITKSPSPPMTPDPLAAGEAIVAERLPDHRLAYLDYEGGVSEGRGSVRRIDAGEYEPLDAPQGSIRVRLWGTLLRGTLTLSPLAADPGRWTISWSPQA
jgi:hypothetical protein